MSGAPRNSVKRDADRVRRLKSWRHIRLPLIGELGQLELFVVLPLVFAANVIVATIDEQLKAWNDTQMWPPPGTTASGSGTGVGSGSGTAGAAGSTGNNAQPVSNGG